MRASPVATKSELSESTETRNRALARVRRLRLRIAVSRLRLTEGVVLLLLLRRFLFSPLAPALRLYFSSRRKVPKAARPEPGWQGRRCYHAAAPDPRSSQTSQFGIVAQAAKAACALCLIGTPGCCIRTGGAAFRSSRGRAISYAAFGGVGFLSLEMAFRSELVSGFLLGKVAGQLC